MGGHCTYFHVPNRQVENDFFKPSAMEHTGTVTETAAEVTLLSSIPPNFPDDWLKMYAISIYIPKVKPGRPFGEDAHFIYLKAQTVGVADGVGGWSKVGIDAGEYARKLMRNSCATVHSHKRNGVLINPKRVLQEAYHYTAVKGSSTACIVALYGNKLRAVNVGDSGFMVVRDGAIVYRSPVQQVYFNCPYQLGKHRTCNDPSVAEEIEVPIRSGDLMVLGTDGLFDNVDGAQIVEILLQMDDIESQLFECGRHLAKVALYNSTDRFARTPFSVESEKAGQFRPGGKADDITVILARFT